jgi:xanthine dehydrogenase YagT iron-sulfur-binding subunit
VLLHQINWRLYMDTRKRPAKSRNATTATNTQTADGAGTQLVVVELTINGSSISLQLDPRTSLLDALREELHLTGTKKGCDQGQCGACTVHIDGKPALSCLTLAARAQGKQITTIEGLEQGDVLHPVQQAFIDQDAFQCGYCTPGQIMSAVACITGGHTGTDDEIREFMSGNLCRCAAYPNIVAAIRQAQSHIQGG